MGRKSEKIAVLLNLQHGSIKEMRLAIDAISNNLVETRIEIEQSENGDSNFGDCLSQMRLELEKIKAAVREAEEEIN